MAESLLRSFLQKNNLGKYETKLREYGIESLNDLLGEDAESLNEIAEAEEVNMSKFHKKKFVKAILQLQEEQEVKDDRSGFLDVPQLKELHVETANRNIMVIGETGTGKSSFLNSCVNYLFETKYDDAFRYKLVNVRANSTQSDTENVNIYRVNPSKLPYQLTIIDTPGFGDTRGITRDQEITQQIKMCFEKHVQEIDGILFVIKSSTLRLTPTQKYVFGEILKIFSKDISENIFIICTHQDITDTSEPKALQAIKDDKIIYKQWFAFNNAAFELLDKANNETRMINQIAWKRGIVAFDSLFDALQKVAAKSLTLSVQVLMNREIIQNLITFKLRPSIIEIFNGYQKVKSIQEQVMNHAKEIEQGKNFMILITETKVKKKQAGELYRNCDECKRTCGLEEKLKRRIPQWKRNNTSIWVGNGKNVEEKDIVRDTNTYVKNMRNTINGVDSRCPCGCMVKNHRICPWVYVSYTEQKSVESQDLKQKYYDKTKIQGELEQWRDRLEKEVKKKEQIAYGTISFVCKLTDELNRIALRPVMFVETKYIDQMIESTSNEERKKLLQTMKTNQKLLENVVSKEFNIDDYIKRTFVHVEQNISYSDDVDEKEDNKFRKYSIRCGLALIICVNDYKTHSKFDNLDNAVTDKQLMIDLFRGEYKYNIIHNENDIVTLDDFDGYINQARTELYQNSDKYDAFVCVFSGHGDQRNIFLSDGKKYGRIDLYKFFNGLGCKTFSKKPKILFFDACKGSESAPQIQTKGTFGNACEYPNHPDDNIVVFNANSDSYLSYDVEGGGVLIQSLYNVLKQNQNEMSMDSMSKRMDLEMKKICNKAAIMQTLEKVERGITTNIYFCKSRKPKPKGDKSDAGFLNEKWIVEITENGNTKIFDDTQIICDHKQKQIQFNFHNAQTNVTKQMMLNAQSFEINDKLIDKGSVCIELLGSHDVIKIECKAKKAAKYWIRQMKPLTKKG